MATLKKKRSIEEAKGIISSNGVKAVMRTVLDDLKHVASAFKNL